MFIIISDNNESYSDHRHQTILVCNTEKEAIDAVQLLRDWLWIASRHIKLEWEHFHKDPNRHHDNYCLNWEQFSNKIKPMPIQVHTGCFPDRCYTEEDLQAAINYLEVPTWARN